MERYKIEKLFKPDICYLNIFLTMKVGTNIWDLNLMLYIEHLSHLRQSTYVFCW